MLIEPPAPPPPAVVPQPLPGNSLLPSLPIFPSDEIVPKTYNEFVAIETIPPPFPPAPGKAPSSSAPPSPPAPPIIKTVRLEFPTANPPAPGV